MPLQPDSALTAEPELFYDWNGEGQPVAVSVNLNLIDRLSMEVMEGFKSLPKRGLEVGGLLLGRVEGGAHEPLIVVEDREVFQSEHLLGPSFLLSPHDREEWAALATRWSAETNAGYHAVGLFRSDTRLEPGFDDEDASLAQELFGDGVGIFLLIRPSARGAGATVGILRDGALQPIGEFPFQSAVLRDGPYPVGMRNASFRPAVIEERPRLVLPDPRSFRATRVGATTRVRSGFAANPIQWRKLAAWGSIPLVAALGLLILAVSRNHTSPSREPAIPAVAISAAVAPPPAADPLSLKVEHLGRELKLSWNHAADIVQRAGSGILHIEDGRVSRELLLNPIELRTGSIMYLPKSGNVTFQLQLSSASRSATESIISVDPGYLSGESSAPPTVSSSKTSRSRQRSSRSKPDLEAVSTNAPVAPPKPVERITIAPPESPPPAPAPPPPSTEPVRAAPASPPKTVTAYFEPLSPTRLKRVMGHLSPARFVRGRDDKNFVPAKPLHQAPPKTPPSVLREVREPVSVAVRVAIDKQGKVANATLDSPAKKGPLPEASVAAARNWTFTPARRGSTPVASQAIVRFLFQNPDYDQADR